MKQLGRSKQYFKELSKITKAKDLPTEWAETVTLEEVMVSNLAMSEATVKAVDAGSQIRNGLAA